VMDDKKEKLYKECLNTIGSYRKALKKKMPKVKKYKKKAFQLTAGATKEEFVSVTNKIKKNILEGDILLANPSRELTANYNAEPLDIYLQLKQILQGRMFYINSDDGILLGSGLNTNLRVKGDKEKIVEASIIGKSNPRGLVNGSIDKDLDNKYEAELKVNSEEVARHIVLIDFARNDLARISERGSIYTDRLYAVEKHSNVQYLASNVKCILRNDLDALHVYLAIMNAQAGTPKITAIKLLRQYEKTKRGFYGGSFCCMTPGGDLNSTIITRALKLKNNKAYARAEANLTYNTLPENAFQETEDMAKTFINAIKLSGGLR
ncbi:MAG: chorismate-binding protein, partial [Nanoarchaeota archaeon]